MKFKWMTGAFLVLVSLSSHVDAQSLSGWYLGVSGGVNHKSETRLESTQKAPTVNLMAASGASSSVNGSTSNATPYSIKTKQGNITVARIGYRFSPNWRAELEGAYAPSKFKSALVGQSVNAVGQGKLNQSSAMMNVFYDILPTNKVHPFVGLGAGAIRSQIDYQGTNGPLYNYAIRQTKTAPAYQALAGLSWAITNKLNLDLTYRYQQATKSTYLVQSAYNGFNDDSDGPFEARSLRARSAASAVFEEETRGKYRNESISLGLRYVLGKSRPAAKPVIAEVEPVTVAVATPPTQPMPVPVRDADKAWASKLYCLF